MSRRKVLSSTASNLTKKAKKLTLMRCLQSTGSEPSSTCHIPPSRQRMLYLSVRIALLLSSISFIPAKTRINIILLRTRFLGRHNKIASKGNSLARSNINIKRVAQSGTTLKASLKILCFIKNLSNPNLSARKKPASLRLLSLFGRSTPKVTWSKRNKRSLILARSSSRPSKGRCSYFCRSTRQSSHLDLSMTNCPFWKKVLHNLKI